MEEQEYRERARACQALAATARLASIRARWATAAATWTERADRVARAGSD